MLTIKGIQQSVNPNYSMHFIKRAELTFQLLYSCQL